MMKLIIFFILVSMCYAYPKNKSRLVHIVCTYKKDGKITTKHGSGFWLDNQYVLTAQHVISNNRKVSICLSPKDDPETPASIVAEGNDFAILKSSIRSSFQSIKFARSVDYGQTVYSWSTYDVILDKAADRVPILNIGTIASEEFLSSERSSLIINGLIHPGASGAALTNEDGELIGVIHGYFTNGDVNWNISATSWKTVEAAYKKLPQ